MKRLLLLFFLLTLLVGCGGEPEQLPSSRLPSFSAGMDVCLVTTLGDMVPVFQIKQSDCAFKPGNSTDVPTDTVGTILEDVCYSEKMQNYYYAVRAADVM